MFASMRTIVLVFFVALGSIGCGGTTGACESALSGSESCVDGNERACEPMVSLGATFHAGQTCEELGYTVCDANGCRRP